MITAILALLQRLFARPPGAVRAEGPAPALPAFLPLSPTDRDVLIRTLFGEAGNESDAGQIAVVHVIRNRLLRGPASRFGGTPAGVCQKPWQFSCWNPGDPMRARLDALTRGSATYERLGAIVDRAWQMPDSVGGADHYAANYIARPSWAAPPAKMVKQIGVHQFYTGVA